MGERYKALYSGRLYDTPEEAREDDAAWQKSVTLNEQINAIKPTYIGGSKAETRKKFWEQDPVLVHAVDSVADLYGINSNALRQRLSHEGFVDEVIKLNNKTIKEKGTPVRGYDLLASPFFNGYDHFGLDDVATYITNGDVKLSNKKRWHRENYFDSDAGEFYAPTIYYEKEGINEKGRKVKYAEGEDVADNIGLTAATLKMFKDKVKKDFPNLDNYEANRYALAYFNRGAAGGKKWAEAGANPQEYRFAKRNGGRISLEEIGGTM